MRRILLSLYVWTAAGILTVLLWVFSALHAALFGFADPDRRAMHRIAIAWALAVVKVNPMWKLKVTGRELLDPKRHYVFVSNHASMADIALLPHMRHPYKCFAKAELYGVPFFGWSLSLHRHIRIRRGSLRGIAEAMREARRWIDRGMSVVFFAEGTRSRSGEIGSFKNGAFKLAIQTQTPVVPLVMIGTRDAIPAGSWIFTGRVSGGLTVLPPVETRGLTMEDCERLRDDVFDRIRRVLEEDPSARLSA